MQLDMRTIILSYLISNAICTLVMALLWHQNRRHLNGLGFWLVNFVLQLIGAVLIGIRGVIPDFVSVVVGNALALAGNILLYMGLERFVGQRSPQVHNGILLVAFMLIHTYFTLVQPNLAARNINFSAGVLIIYAQSAWLLLHRVDKAKQSATRGVGLMLVGYCLACVARIVLNSIVRPPGNDLLSESGLFDIVLVMTYQMLFIALTFSLALMVNQRLLTEMQDDITGRKRVEKALRESREQYRVLFDSFPLGITVSDRNGQILEVNAESERLLGISQDKHKQRRIDGEAWQIIRPDGSPMPAEEYASVRALQEGRLIKNVEMGIIKTDGETTWINVTAAPLKDNRVVVAYNDISARKQVEAALRESEARFRTIVNALPQLVAYTDKDLVYRFVNQTYQQKFSVTPEDVVGKTLPEVIGEEAFEEARPHVEKALQGEQVRYHERYDYAIGGTRDIDGILVPDIAGDGAVRGYYAVLTDITPYMEMQEELRQTTERLRIQHEIEAAILRAQTSEEIAIATLERLHHIIPCRHASIAELDLSQQRGRDTIILVDGEVQPPDCSSPRTDWNSPQTDWNSPQASDWRPLSNASPQLLEAIQQGQSLKVHDITALETLSPLEEMLKATGIRSYVSVPLLVQHIPFGTLNLASHTPDFFQASHLDILEEIAVSLAVALQQARLLEQTQQDAETKALLLREVNHRVKNNLEAIIGLLYIEQRHASPEALAAYQPMMDTLIQRITSLAEVHRMLSASAWQPLLLSELAERIIYATRNSFPQSVSVSVDIPPSPVEVMPDEAHHLALVISELIINTLKYATAGREALTVAVDITQQDNYITFTYRDDGPGYSEDALHSDWSSPLKRYNVGLDIVQKVVQRNLRGELILSNDGGAVTEIRFDKGET